MDILSIALGALAAVPLILAQRRWVGNSRRFYASALVIAALILLVFAALRGQGRDIGLELAGVAFFAIVAWWGQRLPLLIGAGWLVHVPWDTLMHPLQSGGHVPVWYLYACIGFDLVVGSYLLLNAWTRLKTQ